MKDKFEKAVGRHVAKLRKERQLTQAQFAELLNVAPETISRLERGISIPSLKTFEHMGRVLNVPVKDIFNLEYSLKSQSSASDKEITRVVNLLKTRKPEEIKLGYLILKDVYKHSK